MNDDKILEIIEHIISLENELHAIKHKVLGLSNLSWKKIAPYDKITAMILYRRENKDKSVSEARQIVEDYLSN